MKKRQKVLLPLTLGCILFNVAAGTLLDVPLLYMDTVGTVLISVLGGIPYGVVTGIATNLLLAAIGGRIGTAYFALVNVAVAITVGLMSRKKFTIEKAVATGFLLSFVSAFFGLFVHTVLLDNYVGTATATLINNMVELGSAVMSATFFSTIASNLVDKLLTCFIVYGILYLLPPNLLGEKPEEPEEDAGGA